jgi:microcystin-dependent protein
MAKIKGIKTKVGDETSAVSRETAVASVPPGGSIAAGVITMLAQSTVPSGWLLCDGAEYSQTTYSSLYGVIGSAYNTHPSLGSPGAGNFRVPDLRDLFPVGMNPTGPAGTTSLGSYSTTGWNHTHTVPAHAHTLGNHTHTMSAHTHSVPSHSHTLGSHTHGIPSHTHGIAQHIHYFGAHRHSASIGIYTEHTHGIPVANTGTTGTSNLRGASNTGTASQGTAASSFSVSCSGTVGSSNLADNGFNTDWASVNDGTATGAATSSTGGASANSSTVSAFTSGAPSTDTTGAPSSNTTSTDGAATTGSANPPYFGVHFIIKT